MDGEYVFSIEEFSYLLFALGAPEMGDQFLKTTKRNTSWQTREKLLLEGRKSLIARGLIRVQKSESGLEDVSIDPDLQAIFQRSLPANRAMLVVCSTNDERKMVNIYFGEDGKWMAQSSHQNGYMIKAGDAGEIPEFVLGVVSPNKPPAPEFPAKTKVDFQTLSEAAEWSLSERKKVLRLEEPWLSEIADTFDPTSTGMITCVSLGNNRDSRSIVFLEGEKYSWVFRTTGYRGRGEIINGGLDRLKEEIAKLVG